MNEQWTKNRFQGLTREELRQAGNELGIPFGPNTSEDTMRKKLCEKLGEIGGELQIPDDPPVSKPVPLRRMQRPRLAPGDKWEGRCHRVRIHRNEESKNHKYCLLSWEFVRKSFPYEETIDMPEPYFFVLKNAQIGTIEQIPLMDTKGRYGTENKEVFTNRFNYDY